MQGSCIFPVKLYFSSKILFFCTFKPKQKGLIAKCCFIIYIKLTIKKKNLVKPVGYLQSFSFYKNTADVQFSLGITSTAALPSNIPITHLFIPLKKKVCLREFALCRGGLDLPEQAKSVSGCEETADGSRNS